MRFKQLLMTSFLAVVLMSCDTPNTTSMVEISPPAITNTPTPIEGITPTKSSDHNEGQKLVQELLGDNSGCKLPCWWGVTPGTTSWVEARQILEKVSLSIGGQESGDVFAMSVHVLLPYPHNFAKYLEHLYVIRNGIVDYIHIYNYNLAPDYFLVNLLDTYGQPTEIWMRTYSKAEMGIQNYTIALFYQDNGMLIEYSTGDPLKEVDGKLQSCLIKEMDSPFIHLWSPEDQRLSPEYAKMFLVKTLPEPMPLLEATGMDIKTFYETFKNPDTDVCLETPKDLWP